ncbi:mCG6352, partial [Mus musculus]
DLAAGSCLEASGPGAERPPAEQSCPTNKSIIRTNTTRSSSTACRVAQEHSQAGPENPFDAESEWRKLGVQQSQGWVHYMIHEPEPHILLFPRPLPKKPKK